MAAPVNASRYVSPNDRMNMEARDNSNRGLDENGQPLDRQNAAKAKPQKLPEPMPMADFLKQQAQQAQGMKHGGSVKKMASGGSASSRGDGVAQRGKTRGKMC
jgi:hypothetical protein